MIIPKGKIVKIKQGGNDILANMRPMTLDSELTVVFSSRFEPLLGNSVGKILTAVSGIAKAVSGASVTGQFKEMGYQMWTHTDPVRFSFSTTFNMVTSAFNDVMKPASTLVKLCLPSEGGYEFGDKITKSTQVGLVAPGPSLLAAFDGNIYGAKEKFSIRVGAFYLPNILIESVEPSYSSDVDEDGYPTWCTLKVDVSSLFTATTDLIDDFNYKIQD